MQAESERSLNELRVRPSLRASGGKPAKDAAQAMADVFVPFPPCTTCNVQAGGEVHHYPPKEMAADVGAPSAVSYWHASSLCPAALSSDSACRLSS